MVSGQGTGWPWRARNWLAPGDGQETGTSVRFNNLLSPRNGDVRAYYEGPIQTLGFITFRMVRNLRKGFAALEEKTND